MLKENKFMGLFGKIFGTNNASNETSKTEKKELFIKWIPLQSIEQLEEIATLSNTETIAIFKHSTRCGISRSVVKMFESSFDEELSNFKVYYVDLLNYRELSNEIGYKFQVLHQSPQLLVIKNELAVAHASHYDIMSINLKTFL